LFIIFDQYMLNLDNWRLYLATRTIPVLGESTIMLSSSACCR